MAQRLPGDLLRAHVLPHLDLVDLTAFGGACREWRALCAALPVWQQHGWKGFRRFHHTTSLRVDKAFLCASCRICKGRQHQLLHVRLCEACKQLPRNRLLCKGSCLDALQRAAPGHPKAYYADLLRTLPLRCSVPNPYGGRWDMRLYSMADVNALAARLAGLAKLS